jgi:hypothetical protein
MKFSSASLPNGGQDVFLPPTLFAQVVILKCTSKQKSLFGHLHRKGFSETLKRVLLKQFSAV